MLFSLAARVLVITDEADREVLEKLIRDLRRFRHPSRVGSVFNDTMFSMFNEEDEDSEGGD